MIWFILAIVFFVIAIKLHKSADNTERKYSNISSPTSIPRMPQKTYWEEYKESNPTKALEIEKLLNIDFSKLLENDVKEKIASVDRFSKGLKCDIAQIKANYIAEIRKYPAELIPQIIESTSKEQAKEASQFHIDQRNTMCAMMITRLKEHHKELGNPDAKINAPSTEDEMKIVKALNPHTKDTMDLQERLKSLREMSSLFKRPISELREYYLTDVKKRYGGTYENFHYLPDAYLYMKGKANELAPRVGLKAENTSYGIMCDWLSDFMAEERQRYVDTKQVKCTMCGSYDIKLNFFKDSFVCNSCNHEFSGI